MFKLGINLLLSRKKWFFLIAATLALVLSSIISIFTASEAIKMGLKTQAYRDYGEHTLVLYDHVDSKESLLKEKTVEKVGQFQLIGTTELENGQAATLGTMDTDAIDLGHISLIKGSFPKNKNEVAVESSYRTFIDKNWKIGEKRTIQVDDEPMEVILTGIINDYSAKWSVPIRMQKGKNDFPNIFLSADSEIVKEADNKHCLVKLQGFSITTTEKYASEFIFKHTNNGIINHRLNDWGLAHYETISWLAIIFQTIVLVSAVLSMFSLFYFFNHQQTKKFGIMSSLGAKKKDLFKIALSQNSAMFIAGVVFAIPLQILLHFLIIQNTFHVSDFFSSRWLYILGIVFVWMIVVFVLINFYSIQAIKSIDNYSINEIIKEQSRNHLKTRKIPIRLHSFMLRQIWLQLLTYPKHAVILILTITISILAIVLSFFVAKESAGIWDEDLDYYLNSQEIYGFDTVDNLAVLLQGGLTFGAEDTKQLENMDGVRSVKKKPFMPDVFPLLDNSQLTANIHNWILQNSEDDLLYKGSYIVPKVEYVLLDKDAFLELYPNKHYEDFQGKVIFHIPHVLNDSADETLIDETINFVRKYKNENDLNTQEWSYQVFDVSNEPFTINIGHSKELAYDSFTIVLPEETVIDNGMFRGYSELSVYLEDNLDMSQSDEVEDYINQLIAITPGSLYQNVSAFMIEDNRISEFVGYLGKVAFTVSVILSILNITVITFSKYRIQKKKWGTYLSLGMKKRDVYYLLFNEMLLYFVVALGLSFAIFFTIVFFQETIYPFLFYTGYFSLAALTILLFIMLGWAFIIRSIKNQSIYSMIREDE